VRQTSEMSITFHIPGPLRAFTAGLSQVEIASSPATLRDALESLCTRFPGIRDRIVNEEGQVREHINVFVGNEDVRYTGGLATRISAGAEILIIPAISGGRGNGSKTGLKPIFDGGCR